MFSREPALVIDSAMNGNSAEKLVQALKRYFPGRRIIFIFGASNDHPIRDMLTALLSLSSQMFIVASHHPRAEKLEKLAVLVAEMGYQIRPM